MPPESDLFGPALDRPYLNPLHPSPWVQMLRRGFAVATVHTFIESTKVGIQAHRLTRYRYIRKLVGDCAKVGWKFPGILVQVAGCPLQPYQLTGSMIMFSRASGD